MKTRTLDQTLKVNKLMRGYESSKGFQVADEVIITQGFYRGQKGKIAAITRFDEQVRFYLRLHDTEIYVGEEDVRRF